MNKPVYLDHLTGAIPKDSWGYTVSSYTVILEAWRRGLQVKFINKNRSKAQLVYEISNGEKKHVFTVARGDLVPREAILTCIDKSKTKQTLLKNNVPTPTGKIFEESAQEAEITAYADEIGYPLVIKPVDGTGGTGVITGIEDVSALTNSIQYLKNDLKIKDIIVERYVEGKDYRLYVIDNEVIGAFTRDRANVIGDGTSTIKKLVSDKNKIRALNPALKGKSTIKLGKEAKTLLEEKNYNFDSVPKKGEKVYLNTKNNVSSGGDPTDATDFLNDDIKQIAIKAANAIPGLVQAGVDMIINDEQTQGNVIEINSRPHIRSHIFPLQGEARDIPKAIIDFYFPETKGTEIKNFLFFDFKTIYQSFAKGVCAEFVLPMHPTGDLDLKRFEITNVNYKKKFGLYCSKQAKRLGLNGYVKSIGPKKVSLVLSGNIEEIQLLIKGLKKTYKLVNLTEKPRKSPTQVGFRKINMLDDRKKRAKSSVSKYVTSNPNDPNIDGYFPLKLIESTSDQEKSPKEKPIKKKGEISNNKSGSQTKSIRSLFRFIKKK